jgi:hypothetical protein
MFSGFRGLGLTSLWVLLGSFMGCSRVLLLGFRVLLGAFCRLALVGPVYLGAPYAFSNKTSLIKKKKWNSYYKE